MRREAPVAKTVDLFPACCTFFVLRASAREFFTKNGIASYDTPDEAVNAFLHLVHFRRNQLMLRETPETRNDTRVSERARERERDRQREREREREREEKKK